MTKKRRSARKSDQGSEEKEKAKAKEEKAKAKAKATSGERSADEELYTRNVLIRGEAARPDEEGELPPEATHEIVEGDEEREGELPEIRRRRFSAY